MVVYSVHFKHQQPTAAIVHAEAGTHVKWLCINTGYCQSAAVVKSKRGSGICYACNGKNAGDLFLKIIRGVDVLSYWSQ